MTEHEKQQLVDEGTHEWCEECDGEGEIVDERRDGFTLTHRCGYCDGEGIVAKEMLNE